MTFIVALDCLCCVVYWSAINCKLKLANIYIVISVIEIDRRNPSV